MSVKLGDDGLVIREVDDEEELLGVRRVLVDGEVMILKRERESERER